MHLTKFFFNRLKHIQLNLMIIFGYGPKSRNSKSRQAKIPKLKIPKSKIPTGSKSRQGQNPDKSKSRQAKIPTGSKSRQAKIPTDLRFCNSSTGRCTTSRKIT